jgi:hypothetical protein
MDILAAVSLLYAGSPAAAIMYVLLAVALPTYIGMKW